jgi:hypothetical protein
VPGGKNVNIMLETHKLICDTFCEIYSQIEPYCDDSFWDFGQHEPVAGSVTVISRQTFNQHYVRIKELAESGFFYPVLANPTEGSATLKHQCERLGLIDLLKQGRLALVGCGNMEPELPHLFYDSYLCKPYEYQENRDQCARVDEIYAKLHKPYKFLFLNGRTRPHRKYMIESLRPILDQALWTNLDSSSVYNHTYRTDILTRPGEIRLLPAEYEVPQFHTGLALGHQMPFVKNELFNNLWGEIYIQAEPYIDTYFSVVTETVCDYPYSLRSEKIYKPIAMGHPWIVAANCGFYRDIRNQGFQTYNNLIDESFDSIHNNQDRLDRIVAVVQDLCQQDLAEFLVAAEHVSKYNQQHMADLGPRIRAEFPQQFLNFVEQTFKLNE